MVAQDDHVIRSFAWRKELSAFHAPRSNSEQYDFSFIDRSFASSDVNSVVRAPRDGVTLSREKLPTTSTSRSIDDDLSNHALDLEFSIPDMLDGLLAS